MSTNSLSDTCLEDENRSQTIKYIKDELETLKNPSDIKIYLRVDIEDRDRIYDSLAGLSRNKIISIFKDCDPIDIAYDFVSVTNKKRKTEIRKLEQELQKMLNNEPSL